MLNRRDLVIGSAGALALGVALTLGLPAAAAPKTFDQKDFAAAQSAGKPIVLHVHAPWCPTCRAQEPILSRIEGTPKFKGMVFFRIDFDSRKDVLRGFRVNQQSTLIVFKGSREVGRSTGDTNAASIEALVGKAL